VVGGLLIRLRTLGDLMLHFSGFGRPEQRSPLASSVTPLGRTTLETEIREKSLARLREPPYSLCTAERKRMAASDVAAGTRRVATGTHELRRATSARSWMCRSRSGPLKGYLGLADSRVVDAGRRQPILVRYLAHSRQIEKSAARHHYAQTEAEEATSRQRWAELDLTKRELAVLQLIADGHANREIAQQLFVAPETVKSHVRNLFAKLQARSRAHAVAIALRHGLIN
jgi:DNA-binding CsgD family transcriptional regulator